MMPIPRINTGQLLTINRTSARYLGQVWCVDVYHDRALYVLNTPWGQVLGTIIMPWVNRIAPKLARWEAKRRNWKDGEFYPTGSMSYMVGSIYRLVNRFARKTDGSTWEIVNYGRNRSKGYPIPYEPLPQPPDGFVWGPDENGESMLKPIDTHLLPLLPPIL